MTISSTTRVAGPFIGNGSTATFPFAFVVFKATDLAIFMLNVAEGVTSQLVLTTDYSVTLNADQDTSPGGSITLTAGNLAAGITLTITTAMAALQNVDLTNGGAFYPDVINGALDALTILVQQLQGQVSRCLQFGLADTVVNPTLPPVTIRAGQVLSFDSVTGAPVSGNAPVHPPGYGEVIATAAQTVFPTPLYTPGENNLFVIRGGTTLTNGVDYTETGPASITMTTGDVAAGEIFVFRVIW